MLYYIFTSRRQGKGANWVGASGFRSRREDVRYSRGRKGLVVFDHFLLAPQGDGAPPFLVQQNVNSPFRSACNCCYDYSREASFQYIHNLPVFRIPNRVTYLFVCLQVLPWTKKQNAATNSGKETCYIQQAAINSQAAFTASAEQPCSLLHRA